MSLGRAPEEEGRSPNRKGFGRWLSDIASAGREVKRVARETRDAMVLLRHSAKHGEQALQPADELQRAIQVEVLSATDLSYVKSLPVPYCVLVTGYPDQPWARKCSNGREYKTAPALRERHPRWNALCHVAFPPQQVSVSRVDFSKASEDEAPPVELCLRVMDAGGLRGDRMAGEARVTLEPSARRGAGTFRLMGGGYGTVSLRWCIPERMAAAGAAPKTAAEEAFERASEFWARQELSTSEGVTHAQLELAAILATESTQATGSNEACSNAQPYVNEMILQAPLSALLLNDNPQEIQGSEVQGPGSHSLMTVLLDRLELLTPHAGSRLIGALVEKLPNFRGSTSLEDPNVLVVQRCGDAWEDFLCKVFLHFRGSALTELKRLIDGAGAGHDLRRAVYTVISNEVRRSMVLKHFAEEAERLSPKFPLHLLSDIDQTVFIGTFGAGGPKFPVGPVPGALRLYRALGNKVTFLSARPPIWEGQTRRLLDEIGIAEAVVLPGSLKAVAQVLFAPEQAKQAMQEKKTEVFGQFATLHPEAQFIFFGDSGEGDIDFAEQFMEASRCARNAGRPPRAALIHDVARSDGIMPKSNATTRSELRLRGIHVFDTYAGAALQLFMLGLLDEEGLRSASQGNLEEFGEINVVDFASNEVFEMRRMELLRDIREVNDALRAADRRRSQGGAASAAYPADLSVPKAASAAPTRGTPCQEQLADFLGEEDVPSAASTAKPQELLADFLGEQKAPSAAASSTAKPQAEEPLGAQPAEETSKEMSIDLLGQEEAPSAAASSTAKPQAEEPLGAEPAEETSKEMSTDLLGQEEAPSAAASSTAKPQAEEPLGAEPAEETSKEPPP